VKGLFEVFDLGVLVGFDFRVKEVGNKLLNIYRSEHFVLGSFFLAKYNKIKAGTNINNDPLLISDTHNKRLLNLILLNISNEEQIPIGTTNSPLQLK
jgi:hypothetical protein